MSDDTTNELEETIDADAEAKPDPEDPEGDGLKRGQATADNFGDVLGI